MHHFNQNREAIEGFAGRLHILDYDQEAAKHFAQLRVELKGEMIGSYDTMIAAHARSRGLILITNNTREFGRVKGLRVESWVSTSN